MTTETNMIDDAIADAVESPANESDAPEEAPVVLTKAEKAARRKTENEAKKVQAAKDKKAADKVKATEKATAAKEKSDAKQLTLVQKDAMVLINAGLKAMDQVGKGNLLWTVSAHKLRELTKGTGVNFKDEALEHWGVEKNTATKLANAGRLLNELTNEGGDQEWLAYMPMGNVNNMSTIAGMSDKKIALGIDTDVIKMDATEADINEFNRNFDDRGKEVIVIIPPSTPAADADAEAAEAETVSESETPAKFVARVAKGADDMNLSPSNRIKLICLLSAGLKDKRVDAMFTALEHQHPAAPADADPVNEKFEEVANIEGK